ncbi:MAG: APC family permease [Acidiferrobacteraceae bacterium]
METETRSGDPAALGPNRVSGVEILGHTVANITPSAMAAVTVSLVVLDAGPFAWISYLAVGVIMWLVAKQVAQLAANMPAAGSMFVYLGRGLHPLAGVAAGWSMIGGYLGALLAAPVLAGLFASKALAFAGVAVAGWPLAILCAILSWGLAVQDIGIAARASLVIEAVSLLAMVVIGAVTLYRKGPVDPRQFDPRNFHWAGLLQAGTLTVLAYGGFETAGNLARESRAPARAAPDAMTASVVLVGVFFIFMAYATVAGFSDQTLVLGRTTAPLNWLAVHERMPVLGFLADFGMATAAFSATIATFNSIARVMYSMARHRVLPRGFSVLHRTHRTPVAALAVLGIATTAFSAVMQVFRLPVLKVIDVFGIFTSLGFLVIYVLTLIAVPVHARRNGGPVSVLSWVALGIGMPVLLRVLATNIYPVPPFPKDWVTVAFFAYLLLGILVFQALSRKDPDRAAALSQGIAGD